MYCSDQARGETAVREEFPEATIVRPATCFGHEDHFLNYYACKLDSGLSRKWSPQGLPYHQQ